MTARRPVRVVALLLLAPRAALAHGFGQRYDLPVPLWLWVAGAAAAVGLSFVVIGLLVKSDPGPGDYPRLNLLRWRPGRLLVDRRGGVAPPGGAVAHAPRAVS